MILYFHGPNTFASRRKLSQMIETYIAKTGSNLGLERIDGATTDIDALTSNLLASPLLSSSRLVIIENLVENKQLRDQVLPLLDRIPQSTVAVFFEAESDQRTAYHKTLLKEAKSERFDHLDPVKLREWVKREVTAAGASIEPSALQYLIETAAGDQWRLHHEVSKLISYNPKISLETAKKLVEPSFQQTIFDLVEAISRGAASRALQIYRGLIEARTDPMYVLNMVLWQLRNLMLAKAAGSLSPLELSQQAGMSPYVAGKSIGLQRELSAESIKQGWQAAIETDFAIKSGEGEAELLIERLIYKLSERFT